MPESKLTKLVESGDLKSIEDAVQEELDAGTGVDDILDAMVRALTLVGERFQKKEIFISEMLISAMTIQRGVNMIRPLYSRREKPGRGTYIIGTVKGDLHDIGKNIVIMMLEAEGFEVVDLGVDVSPEGFVEAVRSHPECRMVGVSALLTTTLEAMKETVEAIRREDFGRRVYIMVGGTPVTTGFAEKIGADVYTQNAGEAALRAIELADRLRNGEN